MKFDEILVQLGEFGPYQKRIYVLVATTAAFSAMHKMAWVFLAAVPHYRCMLPIDEANATYTLPESVFNATIPWDSTHQQWSSCEMLVNGSREVCHRWIYDTSQYKSSVVTDLNLVCGRNFMRATLQSMVYVGECAGSLLVTILSDRFGRKKSLLGSMLGLGISGICWAFIPNFYGLAIIRVFIGLFAQGIFLVGFVLAVEFVGISKRVLAGSLINYFFAFGYVIITGIAYLLTDWKYLQLAISIPPLVYIIPLLWAPESARWLIGQNKKEEAMKIIKKVAKLNETDVNGITLKHEPRGSLNLKILCKNFTIMYKVLIMCYTWLAINATYYGLSLNTSNLGGNDYINFLIAALVEFPSYTIAIFATDYFGRRLPVCLSTIIAGLSLMSCIFVPPDMVVLTIVLTMIGKCGVTIAYAIIYIFAIELYPTNVRNGALGVNSTFARVGGFISPYIIILADYWRPLPLLILGAMSTLVALLIYLLPETHERALPETYEDASDVLMKPIRKERMSQTDNGAH